MAISRKGKRKITVDGKEYLWWVFNEQDQTEFDGNQIKVVASDQVGYIKYGLEQNDLKRYVVIALREHKYKVHFYCPKFESEEGIISNSGIERLVQFCLKIPTKENQNFTHGFKTPCQIIPKNERLDALKTIIRKFKP